MKGKIFLAVAVAIAAYLVYSAFFANSFSRGVAEMRELEQKNNAQESFLVPVTLQEIVAYKKGLNSLKKKYAGNSPLNSLFDIKLSLAQVEENLLDIGDEFSRSGKTNPDCSASSGFLNAKQLAKDTLSKAESALAKRNAFLKNFPAEAGQVQEIKQVQFEGAIFAVKNGVRQIQKILDTYC
ncbi:MAG: hypothetical protein AABW85_05035 [archaeon]